MKGIKYIILIISVCFILFPGNLCWGEIPKSIMEKKELTSLDWVLLKVAFDIKDGIDLHKSNPGLDKWRMYPVLRIIRGGPEGIFVSYDILDRNFPSFSSSRKREQFEKIISFTEKEVKKYIETVQRNDFIIQFLRDGKEVAKLEKGKLTIK